MKFHPMPPIDLVRELLSYCPETRMFTHSGIKEQP